VPVSGLWRWSFRGGASGDAFAALWGGIFDWLAAERRDLRPAIPADALVREGDAIRWRRGSAADSVATVLLTARDRPGQPTDTLTLAFAGGSSVAESPALSAGSYDVHTSAGPALLIVNASREWLPRAPSVVSGDVRGTALAGAVPHLRGMPWVYVLLVVMLCAEWLWRRHIGLR
jgi:hypothetical protein